jgi:poly(3-hydroxybutyrate) depolymerase
VNAEEIALQWREIHGAESQPAQTEVIQGSRRRVYKNRDGRGVVEVWEIAGMGHGIAVDPDGTGEAAGGAAGAYAFDRNIWSSYQVAKFWGLAGPGQAPGGR